MKPVPNERRPGSHPRNRRRGLELALVIMLVLASSVSIAGCRSSNLVPHDPITLQIAGSTSMEPVLRDLTAAYQAAHADVVLDYQGGGSTAGADALVRGQVSMAAVSWHPQGAPVPDGLQAVPVARDGVAIVVHPRNTLRGLTLLQVRALYEGSILDWAALGGPGGEPVLVSREDGSGTRAAFEALVMGGERVTLDALVMPNTQAVVNYVASHPAAIGYVSIAGLDGRVRALAIEDISPSLATVSAGSYHLSRILYLYLPVSPPAATRSFVDFVLSPTGQAIVAKHLVPLRTS